MQTQRSQNTMPCAWLALLMVFAFSGCQSFTQKNNPFAPSKLDPHVQRAGVRSGSNAARLKPSAEMPNAESRHISNEAAGSDGVQQASSTTEAPLRDYTPGMDEPTNQDEPLPPLQLDQFPKTMRVRGQSPNAPYSQPYAQQPPFIGGNQLTPGNSDLYRGPMQPSGNAWPTPPNAFPNAIQNAPANYPYAAPYQANPYSGNPYGGNPLAGAANAPIVRYQNAPVMAGQPPAGFAPNGGGMLSPSDLPIIDQGPFNNSAAPPLDQRWEFQGPRSPTTGYQPNVRDVPIDVYVQEAQTGKFVFGGSVNTDLGVAGQIIVEERNFDIRKFPTRFSDLANGAFRGNGENFRLEAMPGNRVQRYSINWTQPNLFGYSPWSLSLGGFYFNRIYRDWDEQRLGGRGMLGYQVTPDLSLSTELRAESVKIYQPRVLGVPQLDNVLGNNELYTGRFRLAHSTRDSVYIPTEGHFLELIYDQVFGTYDFPRGQLNYSKYFLIRERADGGGRHTLTNAWKVGVSGAQTPLFENYFAGGFTTMRGFSFRGASPVEGGVQVGGRFMFLGSLEYMMPITADDMLRMVAFVDYGTIEQDIKMDWDNFRVAPGIGLRVSVPVLGPGPLAFDFAYPISSAATDDKQVFSFSVGLSK